MRCDHDVPSAAPTSSIGVKIPPGTPDATDALVAITFAARRTPTAAHDRRPIEHRIQGLVAVSRHSRQPHHDRADERAPHHRPERLWRGMPIEPRLERGQQLLEASGGERRSDTERGERRQFQGRLQAKRALPVNGPDAHDDSCQGRRDDGRAHGWQQQFRRGDPDDGFEDEQHGGNGRVVGGREPGCRPGRHQHPRVRQRGGQEPRESLEGQSPRSDEPADLRLRQPHQVSPRAMWASVGRGPATLAPKTPKARVAVLHPRRKFPDWRG